jgi:hypothetical protein
MTLPIRRARAIAPLFLAAGIVWLHPDRTPAAGLLIAVGLASALAVGFADSRSALDRWQRRHPGVAFGGIERFPDGAGVEPFDDLCAVVQQSMAALNHRSPRGIRERALERKTRRELAAALALGARLAVRLEQLEALSPSGRTLGATSERRRVAARLDSLPRVATAVRDALVRSSAPVGAADCSPLEALVGIERELTARRGALAELRALEITE